MILPLLFALSATDVDQVVRAAATQLEQGYVAPDTGRALAERLRRRLRDGAYRNLDGPALAVRLTDDLRALSGDGHLRVEHHADAVPEEDAALLAQERERHFGARLNFGFQKVERLDDNLCVLDLRTFAPVDMGGEAAAAAMTSPARTGRAPGSRPTSRSRPTRRSPRRSSSCVARSRRARARSFRHRRS